MAKKRAGKKQAAKKPATKKTAKKTTKKTAKNAPAGGTARKKPTGGQAVVAAPARASAAVVAMTETEVLPAGTAVEQQYRLALDRRALDMKVAADRERRVDEFLTAYHGVEQPVLAPPGVTTMSILSSGRRPVPVLAEGDSWFDYPLASGGTIAHLERMAYVGILNLAHYGHEVRQMMSRVQRRQLEEMLERGRSGVEWQALLFSGGGNDFVGDQFSLWLKRREDAASADEALHEDRVRHVMGIVESGYRELIAVRDRVAPNCIIFTHGYDFPYPSWRKACGVGPWLRPSLEDKGWHDEDEQFRISRRLLERFGEMLERLEAEQGDRFVYVRTQGTLEKRMWANEIHPTSEGFSLIAEAFLHKLRERLGHVFPSA